MHYLSDIVPSPAGTSTKDGQGGASISRGVNFPRPRDTESFPRPRARVNFVNFHRYRTRRRDTGIVLSVPPFTYVYIHPVLFIEERSGRPARDKPAISSAIQLEAPSLIFRKSELETNVWLKTIYSSRPEDTDVYTVLRLGLCRPYTFLSCLCSISIV